jgi:DNA-3-methyladenine glycosylase I
MEKQSNNVGVRCAWVNSDPVYLAYHDREWGVPDFDDRSLFEKLILDGAQAGLSWYVILKKREGYRRAFDGFDAERMARYDARKVAALMRDPNIVRNRLKIEAAIGNARAYLALCAGRESFADFIWQFVDGQPLSNQWNRIEEVPATTPESDAMSKELKRRGFKFVGSTICYAFMQAVGMVNDHVTSCFRHAEI